MMVPCVSAMPPPAARPLCLALTLVAVATPGLTGCSRDPGPPDVVLISIDTLRPDHLGAYGYPVPTTPHLDAFRSGAVLFEEMIAQAPSTLPSHASILTSLIPQHHGASHTFDRALPQEALTVTEVFAQAGYRTIGVVAGGQMAPEYGLDQGFDVYESLSQKSSFQQAVERALALLDDGNGPTFLFLHSYEVHHPYTPAPDDVRLLGGASYDGPLPAHISVELLREINLGVVAVDERDGEHIRRAYDAEIRSMDAGFGRLVQGLESRRRYQNAVIAFTSDHGEEFDEHGWMGWHSHTLYDELLRVPFLIKLPLGAGAGGTIAATVRSLDIAPTLLEIAGLPPRQEFSGRSLLPWILRGRGRDLPAVSWRESPQDLWADHSSLRKRRVKLLEGRLYDLGTDPGEQVDLAEVRPGELATLSAELDRAVTDRPVLTQETVEADRETLEELRALGYLN